MSEQEQRWRSQARRAAFDVYRERGVSQWIEAHGISMRPLIRQGTWLLVEFGATPAGTGEIILFPLGDVIVAHRVVAWRYQQGIRFLVPKGDAEPYCDPLICTDDVIGVVRALRCGATGPITCVGCSGCSAQAIVWISRWGGCGVGLARRAVSFLPIPQRRLALRAVLPIAWAAVQALLAPLHGAAWLQGITNSLHREEVKQDGKL